MPRQFGGSAGDTGLGGARVLLTLLGVAARVWRRRGGIPGLAVAADIAAGNAATSSGKEIASAGSIRGAAALKIILKSKKSIVITRLIFTFLQPAVLVLGGEDLRRPDVLLLAPADLHLAGDNLRRPAVLVLAGKDLRRPAVLLLAPADIPLAGEDL